MSVQTFTTPSGEEMVILSRAEYDALRARVDEAEEDAADVAAFDAAMAATGQDAGREVPSDQICGHFLRFRRKNAGMTQSQISAATGLAQGYISDLESGRRTPSINALEKLALALALDGRELIGLREGFGLATPPEEADVERAILKGK